MIDVRCIRDFAVGRNNLVLVELCPPDHRSFPPRLERGMSKEKETSQPSSPSPRRCKVLPQTALSLLARIRPLGSAARQGTTTSSNPRPSRSTSSERSGRRPGRRSGSTLAKATQPGTYHPESGSTPSSPDPSNPAARRSTQTSHHCQHLPTTHRSPATSQPEHAR